MLDMVRCLEHEGLWWIVKMSWDIVTTNTNLSRFRMQVVELFYIVYAHFFRQCQTFGTVVLGYTVI